MSPLKIERMLRRESPQDVDARGRFLGVEESPRQTAALQSLYRHRSVAAREIARQVELLAKHPTVAVLIEGESGTGKTLVSRAFHDLSPRCSADFVRTDLAAVQVELAASQLFGHLPGSFTGAVKEKIGDFALAHRGTIFLDEIGKCPLPVQQQLLGTIEGGQVRPLGAERTFVVDVRVVTATSVPLEQLVSNGGFLPDLRARLVAGWMRLPPLRERKEDIPQLLTEQLQEATRRMNRSVLPKIADEFMDACTQYEWPGNLRELASVMLRALLEAGDEACLRLKHIPKHFDMARAVRRRFRHVSEAEVMQAYERSGHDVRRTAKLLGVDRSTVYRHIPRPPASRAE